MSVTTAPWPEDGEPVSGDSSRNKDVLPTFASDTAFLTSLRPTRPAPRHPAPRAACEVDRLSTVLRAGLVLDKTEQHAGRWLEPSATATCGFVTPVPED